MIKKICLGIITAYQKTISPDHGWLSLVYPYGFCKFHPSCSEYTYLAIEKHGAIKGSILGFQRILRCNPWNKGGLDPVK